MEIIGSWDQANAINQARPVQIKILPGLEINKY